MKVVLSDSWITLLLHWCFLAVWSLLVSQPCRRHHHCMVIPAFTITHCLLFYCLLTLSSLCTLVEFIKMDFLFLHFFCLKLNLVWGFSRKQFPSWLHRNWSLNSFRTRVTYFIRWPKFLSTDACHVGFCFVAYSWFQFSHCCINIVGSIFSWKFKNFYMTFLD
jgi:hypothetical protein